MHYQQAAVLSYELTAAAVDFAQHIYTDNTHRINTGSNTQRDLYGRITAFMSAE